jgi:putative endonuclease
MAMNERHFWVYILASTNKTLYVGMTGDLERRICQHKQGSIEGFTSRYKINRLVFYCEFQDPRDAIEYEKKLKGKSRLKKVALVEMENQQWEDLADGWFDLSEEQK